MFSPRRRDILLQARYVFSSAKTSLALEPQSTTDKPLEEETRLKPVDSPVIQRVGDRSIMPPNNAVTVAEWVQARYANIPANYARGTGGGDKTSLVKNVEVKTYA